MYLFIVQEFLDNSIASNVTVEANSYNRYNTLKLVNILGTGIKWHKTEGPIYKVVL